MNEFLLKFSKRLNEILSCVCYGSMGNGKYFPGSGFVAELRLNWSYYLDKFYKKYEYINIVIRHLSRTISRIFDTFTL